MSLKAGWMINCKFTIRQCSYGLSLYCLLRPDLGVGTKVLPGLIPARNDSIAHSSTATAV